MSGIKEIVRKILPSSVYNLLRKTKRSVSYLFFHRSSPLNKFLVRVQLPFLMFQTFPPAELRFRVHGEKNLEGFISIGQLCLESIENTLGIIDKKISDFPKVLDFGCGCGRVIIPMAKKYSIENLWGTDIDSDAIFWCKTKLKGGHFGVNKLHPPLSYPSDSFDFIYSISVFTHLSEEHQFEWLEELRRVTAPGGYVLLTFHGESISHDSGALPEKQVSRLNEEGQLFFPNDSSENFLPEWYGTTFHTDKYIREKFTKYFKIIQHIPKGMANHQDIVLFQKAD